MTQPDNATLTHWLAQAGRGNQQSFRRLAQALGPRMHGLACRLVGGNATLAEDITQEVLIKLWQNAPSFKPGGSVAGYVSRMVYTTSMDHHRRTRPTVELPVSLAEPETLSAKVIAHQQKDLILEAMQHLPERQQQAVSLAYFHEYRTREVATALGTTEKAVEGLLMRARKTMATHLAPHYQQEFNA